MTVILTPEAEALIQQKVDSGGYSSTDAVIDAALRLLDERDRRMADLKAAIAVADEQVARGQVTPWSRELGAEILQRAKIAAKAGKKPKADVLRKLPVVITDEAQDDLESIALVGLLNWGEEQADRYHAAIEDVLDSLARFPEMGRREEDAVGNIRTISVGRHTIVYRVEDNTVRVLRIVHGRMEIDRTFDP